MYSVRVNDKDVCFDVKEFVNDIFRQNMLALWQAETLPMDHFSMENEFDYRYSTDGNFKAFVNAVEKEWIGFICMNSEITAFMYGIYGIRIPVNAE